MIYKTFKYIAWQKYQTLPIYYCAKATDAKTENGMAKVKVKVNVNEPKQCYFYADKNLQP